MDRATLEQLSAVASDSAALKQLAADLQINLENLKKDLPTDPLVLEDPDLEHAVGGRGGYAEGLASLIKALSTAGCDGGACIF